MRSITCFHLGQVWYPSRSRTYARPAERPLGWGWGSLRCGAGDGWDQWRLPRYTLGFFLQRAPHDWEYYEMNCVKIISSSFNLHKEQPCVASWFLDMSCYQGNSLVFLATNQACSVRHMVLFMTVGDKCGAGKPSDISEDKRGALLKHFFHIFYKCVNVCGPQRRTWHLSSEPMTPWTLQHKKIPTP